jgi:hypothetical protein
MTPAPSRSCDLHSSFPGGPAISNCRSIMLRILLIVVVTGWCSTIVAPAQTALVERSQQKGRLYRIPGGYLEVAQEGALTQFARYDDTLGFQSAAAAPLLGLHPLDLAPPSSASPGRAFLLAAPFGRTALFSVTTTGIPSIAPVWESTLPPMRRILYSGDVDGDGKGEIAMIGDSAIALVGADGTERYVQRERFIDAVAVSEGSRIRFIVATDNGSVIRLSLLDAATGRELAPPKSLQGHRHAVMLASELHDREVLAVATREEPLLPTFSIPARWRWSAIPTCSPRCHWRS